ncbi:MAG TPA: FG-GAP-like repeat-containing protein, partial [Thermoanaerobaculia bacterium]
RDGRLDLAVTNPGSNQVSILAGNGDGTFQSAVPFAAGNTPRALAAGDFDRDGDLDLAVAASDGDHVAILAGNGNGTFQAPATFAAGDAPESVAVADFNRDGKLDLAVANAASANVSVLLGNGDATFQAAAHFAAGTTPYALVADDLNGDGKADLAVANAGSNNVSLLIGNGSGGFAAATNFAAGTTPQALLAGDFNLDGRLDLATANNGSNNISVLLASGPGTFAVAVQHPVGMGPRALARGDFNRDGRADLVVSNGSSSTISLLANICPIPDLTVTKTHSGSFAQGESGKTYTVTVTNAGFAPTSSPITVADQLPAGLTATSIAGSGWTCTLTPLACSRSDALAPAASYPAITVTVKVASSAAASVTNTVTVTGGGEVNTTNNSASDLTAITPTTDVTLVKAHGGSFMQGATGRTYTLRVRNAGGLATSGTITVTDQLPAGLTATAMSGTGWACTLGTLTCTRNDALAGGSAFPAITLTVSVAADAPSQVVNTASVAGGGDANPNNNNASDPTVIWSSATCGSFASPVLYPGGTSYERYAMAVADFNGDGRPDIAVAGYYRTLSTIMGLDGGTLAAPVNYTLSDTPRRIAAVDLDNDGDVDLVATIYSGVLVLLNDGSGTFAPPVPYAANFDSGYALAVGDLNGDGNVDVVASASYSSNSINVLFGNGNGTLATPVAIALSGSPSAIAVADLDRNGTADLLVSVYGAISVLLGNGSGTFAAPVNYQTADTTTSLAVGDFNADGNLDVAGTTYYAVAVLLGNGNGTLQTFTAYSAGYGLGSLTAADLNADGKLDLLATTSSSAVSTLRGKGDGTFSTATSYYVGSSPSQVAVSDFNRDGKPDLVFSQQYGSSLGIMLGGCADLTITKTHTGAFNGGKLGVYTLKVRSSGAYSSGTVTVKDFLPAGLTADSMYGSYTWSCDLPTLTCTTNDAIGDTETTITLTVSVSASAPTSVTNTATVSGGSDSNPSNNTATDPTTIVHAADLTIRKTHDGTFAYNQSGVYTITVGNIGTGPTTGTVSVTDQLPFGMTATAMTGTGWTCVLQSRTCTREDALPMTQTYSPITLTVAVSSSIGSSVTNVASVSGGGDTNTANNTAYDPTSIVTIPFVTATAQSGTRVGVTWNVISNATTYEVWRSVAKDTFTQVATTISNAYVDTSVSPQKSYRYIVRAVQGAVLGPFSQPDIATTVFFTDDPLIVGSTPPKAIHMQELQLAINAMRGAASLPPMAFTTIAAGTPVQAAHVNELTLALNQARTALGLSTFVAPAPGSVIRGWHLGDLRAAVK